MVKIKRNSLLYKTEVEYGDYTINHVFGCSHGCLYPCYAFLNAKRYGRIKTYEEWIEPKLVENALELLKKEIPKLKSKIQSVHFCFTTDPFMYGYDNISKVSVELIQELNRNEIPCTTLTKGIYSDSIKSLGNMNKYGITLISLDEDFRMKIEPFAAPYQERIDSLKKLHDHGLNTWVSIEPYPTPNIIKQDFDEILKSISFVDKIIFGRMHYNKLITKYPDYKQFYNELAAKVIEFCEKNNIEYHIKNKTVTGL